MMKVTPSKDPRKSEPSDPAEPKGPGPTEEGGSAELPALPSEKELVEAGPVQRFVERTLTVGVLGAVAGGVTVVPLVAVLTTFGEVLAGAFATGGGLPLSLSLPLLGISAALLLVIAAFPGWGALRMLDPRISLEDIEKDDSLYDLPPWLEKPLEMVFMAAFGALFCMPLLAVLELLGYWIGVPAVTAVGYLGVAAFFAVGSAAGWFDEGPGQKVLPGAVLRIGKVLRVRRVRCPYCATRVREDEEAVACESCEAIHHRDCWMETETCTTYGCGGRSAREVLVGQEDPEPAEEPEVRP